MRIIIGADHAGFDIKEKIKKYLEKKKILYEDLGADSADKPDDYPDYAERVARKVVSERDAKGILVCGTGIGMCIAANKVKGARAAAAYDSYTAELSRTHNDANILCLRGRKFPFWKIKSIMNIWINAEFSGEERHKRRVGKIETIKWK
jgi:ribose 5-phosphate isomerase B